MFTFTFRIINSVCDVKLRSEVILFIWYQVPSNLFEPYVEEIFSYLRGNIFHKFVESEKFTRFCQWKNLELNLQLSMNDFSVHRIIGKLTISLIDWWCAVTRDKFEKGKYWSKKECTVYSPSSALPSRGKAPSSGQNPASQTFLFSKSSQ